MRYTTLPLIGQVKAALSVILKIKGTPTGREFVKQWRVGVLVISGMMSMASGCPRTRFNTSRRLWCLSSSITS